ncbi:MAG: aminotransferase class I/II-fold pyridoxal phosphate-dependent enzyme [Actinomycetia bacterium]|nr:aminotransferase class I/II-fold pyridoxal phosphate-dependent enzyme [Actinomycetes bacterium]MCP4223318.1 aminotransferase class I/II-fold pyridoxal phosphate-dependent enzyme [Actinomycetes bacterium]MCP5030201.1 aminotransferase class I/II-fold pyridoxal phosphate-dependent enzyme [Actinomycetes bacterium]
MGFDPPPYPYDRLDDLKAKAELFDGGVVDLSIGTPCDPPPPDVISALASSDAERGYPPSIGTPEFRAAAATWLNRFVGTDLSGDDIRATVGSKEFVAGLPHWLRLRRPDLDTVLYPAISYPSYEMGATLAGVRAVPVPIDDEWRIDLSAISEDDAARALCLWVNTPGNPAGGIDDLEAAARWGRDHDVLVVSDECYAAFTWNGPPQSILQHGRQGLLAVHSLSKRSNLAGARTGFYAGDPDIIHYLGELRKHAGFMQPGPSQAAAVVAFADEEHVEAQRVLYRQRLELMQRVAALFGSEAELPGGGFYLWAPAPDGDAWGFTTRLATEAGVLVSPGEFYGSQGSDYVRVAVVQPDDKIRLVAERAGIAL